jgi:uncharacterized protein YceH (UPF0502 family)
MPFELNFEERRVIGALVEKALTTPDHYPLTQNALVNACNQKSCRMPVTSFGEELVLDTLDALRGKGLCSIMQTVGSRTDRWKHLFREVIPLSGPELAVVIELILRGPQTDGELRQNSKRMVRVESMEALREVLEGLMNREDSLVVRLSPQHRKRGVRYAHTFYAADELERLRQQELAADGVTTSSQHSETQHSETQHSGTRAASGSESGTPRSSVDASEVDTLRQRVTELGSTLGEVGDRVARLEKELGIED